MATKVGSIYTELRARLDKYERDLAKAHGITTKGADKIQRRINKISFRKATASMARFTRLFNTAAVALAGGGALGSLIKISSDYEQSIFQMSQTFQGQTDAMIAKAKDMAENFKYFYDFGDISYAFTKTADSMERYGIVGEKYLQLVSRAADIGAAKNLQLKESIDRIESAMRGEAEASEYLGLTLNDTYMKNIAFEGALKDTWETMTDMQKTQARFAELMNQSAKYQGAAKEAANKLSGAFTSLSNALKDKLAPALATANESFVNILNHMRDIVVESETMEEAFLNMALAWANFLRSSVLTTKFFKTFVPLARGLAGIEEIKKLVKEYLQAFNDLQDNIVRKKIPSGQKTVIRNKMPAADATVAVKQEIQQVKALTDAYIAALPVLKTYRDSWEVKGERTFTDEQIDKAAQLKTAFESLQNATIDEELAKAFGDIDETAKTTFEGLTQLSERTAWAMQDNFSNLFFDAMKGELKSFNDYAMAVFDSIQRAAADIAAQKLTEGLFGGIATSAGGGWLAGLFSGGGGGGGNIATIRGGQGGGYGFQHGGYIGEPVKGIGLKTGSSYEFHPHEVVTPVGKGGGGTAVTVNNYSGQPATVTENTDTDGLRRIVIDIAKADVMRGGQLAQSMGQTFGLARRGRIV